MIIEELCDYYKYLVNELNANIALYGFSSEKISGELVLNKHGDVLELNDIRFTTGKRKFPSKMIVPESRKRTGPKSYENPFFLWDNTGFVLGEDLGNNEIIALKKHESFSRFHQELLWDCEEEDARALLIFLRNWDPSYSRKLEKLKLLIGTNVVFRIKGKKNFIHENTTLKRIWINYLSEINAGKKQVCLATGCFDSISPVHPTIKGITNEKSVGSTLVSCNAKAYESYGKVKNFNAPISDPAAFYYTTTLNYLLSIAQKNSRTIGDTTIIFWSVPLSPLENVVGELLDNRKLQPHDNKSLCDIFRKVQDGHSVFIVEPDTKLCILALSSNAVRIEVRFWGCFTAECLQSRIKQYLEETELIKNHQGKCEFPTVYQIMFETISRHSKETSPSPYLVGSFLRAIFDGTKYPQAIESALINRIRSDTILNHTRIAALKAILCRKLNQQKNIMKIELDLDMDNKNRGYLLGRLFAIIVRAQTDAVGHNFKANIKTRYWAIASSSPKRAFPHLLFLTQFNLKKSKYGKLLDKHIRNIIQDINEFPDFLPIDDQGLFAIGYYQQMQSFFKQDNK